MFFVNRNTHQALARNGEELTMVPLPGKLSDLSTSTALWNVAGRLTPGVSLQNADRFLALNSKTGKLTMSKQDYGWLIKHRAPGEPPPAAPPPSEMIVQLLVGAGHVVNVENGPVAINADKLGDPNPPSHWWSGMWVVVDFGVDNPNNPQNQFFALRNRHTHKYLAVVDGQIVLTDPRLTTPKEQLTYSWKMPITTGNSNTRTLQNLLSGAYLDTNAKEPVNMRSLKLSTQPAPIWMLKRLD